MGPVRSLYEQERDLEGALSQHPSGMLRPVQMSDCGERDKRFVYDRKCVRLVYWSSSTGIKRCTIERFVCIARLLVCILTLAWYFCTRATDTAYTALMGSSVALNTDQDQVAITDELISDEIVEGLDRQTRELGASRVETGAGEGQPCAERESQEDFVEELASRRER